MLYKFKSKATGDLIMLEPNGRRLLEIMGKDPSPKGIILPQQMAAAIAALEAAIAEAQARQEKADPDEGGSDPAASKADAVTLRQRAVPMIDMLRRCLKEDKEIVWGV